MAHPIKRDYTFRVDPEKLKNKLKQYIPNLKPEVRKLSGTYNKHFKVKVLFADNGTRLTIDSKRDTLQASIELEAIVKSCIINNNH